MAMLIVVPDAGPGAVPSVFLFQDQETGEWDGRCTGCTWTMAGETGRRGATADAVQYAEVHVDNQCPARSNREETG